MSVTAVYESPDNEGWWRVEFNVWANESGSFMNIYPTNDTDDIVIYYDPQNTGPYPYTYDVIKDFRAGSHYYMLAQNADNVLDGYWSPIIAQEYKWWELATDSFYNDTGSDVTYHYVIRYYGTGGASEPQSQIGASVVVPANHNLQFTGLLYENFSVHLYREYAGGTAFVGQFYASLTVSEDDPPDEQGVTPHLTEGSTPPFVPENNFFPEWPESPEFVSADDREDQFGEDYDNNPIPDPEADSTDIVEAIDRHDNNRREEHLTDENMWRQSEDNLTQRFDDLNTAQEYRQDEIIAYIAQNTTINSNGHAATKNAIDELNSALTSGVEGAEDPGPVNVDAYTNGQDDSLFESMNEDIQGTVTTILGLVPNPQALPTVSGRDYTYSMSFASYKGADFSFDIDLTPYQSVIELIRSLEVGLVVIMFMVSAIKTVRGGFA